MALVRGELRLVDRHLVLARIGHAEIGSLAIEQIGGGNIRRRTDPVELAPGKHLDSPRFPRGDAAFEELQITGVHGLGADMGDDIIECRHGVGAHYRGRERGGTIALSLLAQGIRLGEAMVRSIKIIELRGRRLGTGKDRNYCQDERNTHDRHHSAKVGFRLAALCVAGGILAACSADSIDKGTLRPGYLGSLIDHPPPPVTVSHGGPSGVLVVGPSAPAMPAEFADRAIADGLRDWLTPIEREGLAGASQRAVAAPTGTPVTWQALDGTGAVTAQGTAVPLEDVFRSRHGMMCRIVRQSVDKDGTPHVQQTSLCRIDEGDARQLWLVAKLD